MAKDLKPKDEEKDLPQGNEAPEPVDQIEVDDKLIDNKLAPTDPTVDDNPPVKGKSLKSPATDIVEQAYTGTAEKTYTESAYVPASMRRPYNPDKLVMRDHTYGIYLEMLEDDQINVAMQIKKNLVVGSGWYIETEDENQADIKKDLEIALGEQCDRPFSDILEEICQSFEFGFSCGEKIFKNREDGSLVLKDIKVRHPATWLFHTDRQGNVERYEQRGLYETVDVDPDSLLHSITNPKFQNPYGTSDLFPCYAPWVTKRHIIRFYAIFLEKAASPTPVAKYDRRAPKEVVDDMFNIIKKFQTKTAIVIPKEFEIEFLESKSTGEAYIKGINLFNMLIGRALFIPDLLGFQGSETSGGSFALGKDQIGMIFRHIYRRREAIERAIDLHVIKPICMYNHGLTEDFPKFKFKLLSDDDAIKQAEMWMKAINGKTWKPTLEEVNHFRDILKFPNSEDIDLYDNNPADKMGGPLDPNNLGLPGGVDENGQPIAGQTDPNALLPPGGPDGESDPNQSGDAAGGNPKDGGNAPPASKGSADKAGNKQAPKAAGVSGKEAPDGGGKGAPPKGPAKTDGKDPAKPKDQGETSKEVKKKFSIEDAINLKGSYHKKVDFGASDQLMKATVAKIMHESAPIVSDIFEDLYDQMQKKTVIARQDLERADSIQLKFLKRLQLVFKKNFRLLYNDAKAQAATEVKKGDFAKANIPADEFLDFLDQETYKYIGDWEYSITRKAKDELIRAIKDGLTLSDVIGVMDDEGNDLSDVSIERYARTKGTEVYNRGRIDYFESTGVVSAYQYSAILDDRTSDICAGLDGIIFDKADAPVPPLHFNCRSMLVPITSFEDYTVDETANDGTNIDDFIDENIGKGFPKE